jgi:hypothetical protein
MSIESLKSHKLEPQTDKHTVNGMDLWKNQSKGEGQLLKRRLQEDNHYLTAPNYQKKLRVTVDRNREVYLSCLNQQRSQEQQSEESLANDQSKWQRTKKDPIANRRKQTEGDLIGNQRRLLRRGKISDKQRDQWLQDCGVWAQKQENEAKLSNKSNLEGIDDGKENTDSTTSKVPFAHLNNHNQSDLFFDGRSNQQADATASKGRSFFPDIKTSGTATVSGGDALIHAQFHPLFEDIHQRMQFYQTSTHEVSSQYSRVDLPMGLRHGASFLASLMDQPQIIPHEDTNSQSHADQAIGYKESKIIRGFDQNGSKSTGSDATTLFGAQKSSDQQSAKAAKTFLSTDDLYKNPKVIELKRAIDETNEGKGISEEENKYARTFQEFLREVRIDREKVVNPLQEVRKMQNAIEKHRLELVNAFDPKLVGQNQKREYKSCAEGLKEKFKEATDYMEREIRYAKSKTNNPSSMFQRSTVVPPILAGVY